MPDDNAVEIRVKASSSYISQTASAHQLREATSGAREVATAPKSSTTDRKTTVTASEMPNVRKRHHVTTYDSSRRL